jgi:hypothetical protein
MLMPKPSGWLQPEQAKLNCGSFKKRPLGAFFGSLRMNHYPKPDLVMHLLKSGALAGMHQLCEAGAP